MILNVRFMRLNVRFLRVNIGIVKLNVKMIKKIHSGTNASKMFPLCSQYAVIVVTF